MIKGLLVVSNLSGLPSRFCDYVKIPFLLLLVMTTDEDNSDDNSSIRWKASRKQSNDFNGVWDYSHLIKYSKYRWCRSWWIFYVSIVEKRSCEFAIHVFSNKLNNGDDAWQGGVLIVFQEDLILPWECIKLVLGFQFGGWLCYYLHCLSDC